MRLFESYSKYLSTEGSPRVEHLEESLLNGSDPVINGSSLFDNIECRVLPDDTSTGGSETGVAPLRNLFMDAEDIFKDIGSSGSKEEPPFPTLDIVAAKGPARFAIHCLIEKVAFHFFVTDMDGFCEKLAKHSEEFFTISKNPLTAKVTART